MEYDMIDHILSVSSMRHFIEIVASDTKPWRGHVFVHLIHMQPSCSKNQG